MKSLIPAMLIAAACGSSRPSGDRMQFAKLSFEIPTSWEKSEFPRRGVETAVFAPRADSNSRKESITIIRSDLSPAVASAGEPTVERLLANAQTSLGLHVKASALSSFTTRSGLRGARVRVEYVPPGQRAEYHRVHVVVSDGSSLVHVLYTAREPDEDTLDLVLSTLRHEEG